MHEGQYTFVISSYLHHGRYVDTEFLEVDWLQTIGERSQPRMEYRAWDCSLGNGLYTDGPGL